MMTRKLGIAVVTSLLFLAPQVVLGLAPGDPDIFVMSSPTAQEVSAGGSTTFTISVISQEGFEDMVQLTLVDPPEGVTATFDPNPVEVLGFDTGNSVMTVNVAAGTPEGEVGLKVTGQGVSETDVERSANIKLNIAGSAQPPPPPSDQQPPPSDQQPPPSDQQPAGPAVTTTVTSTITTTVTTASTVVSTVTDVMTTRTPTIGTVTTIPGFEQAADFTYPAVALVVVVALLAVAALALRRPK